jgi:hypothetical protein
MTEKTTNSNRRLDSAIDSKNGRTYIRGKNCYALYVRARGLPRFTEGIGFTIERKQERLVEAGRLA